MKKALSNVEITNQVINALEADAEKTYLIDFDEILSLVDAGRSDETEQVDVENIIYNLKQRLEIV